jgi:hypothetical protein
MQNCRFLHSASCRLDAVWDFVERLNKEINAGLADPKLKAGVADLGATVVAGSPDDFGKHIAEETEKWAKVIRAANIKPESEDPPEFRPADGGKDRCWHFSAVSTAPSNVGYRG